MTDFHLGERSLAELNGVHDDLVLVVKRAIELTPVDFAVHDGIRTLEEQRELVARGASKTLHSRHLTGHAVDLVPYINRKLRWEWDAIYPIADAMREAAHQYGIPLRWGGCWSLLLTDNPTAPEHLVQLYVDEQRRNNRRAFIDGPHYELPREAYPG